MHASTGISTGIAARGRVSNPIQADILTCELPLNRRFALDRAIESAQDLAIHIGTEAIQKRAKLLEERPDFKSSYFGTTTDDTINNAYQGKEARVLREALPKLIAQAAENLELADFGKSAQDLLSALERFSTILQAFEVTLKSQTTYPTQQVAPGLYVANATIPAPIENLAAGGNHEVSWSVKVGEVCGLLSSALRSFHADAVVTLEQSLKEL